MNKKPLSILLQEGYKIIPLSISSDLSMSSVIDALFRLKPSGYPDLITTAQDESLLDEAWYIVDHQDKKLIYSSSPNE